VRIIPRWPPIGNIATPSSAKSDIWNYAAVVVPSADPSTEQRAREAKPIGTGHAARRPWTPLARGLAVAGDSWTLMIVMELAAGRARLSELRAHLAGVSAGVLDRHLRRMERCGLLRRERFRELPPRVELELTRAGRALLPVAVELARWAQQSAWSEPHEGEQIDPAAVLRQRCALLAGPLELPDADVAVELRERGVYSRERLTLRDGRLLGGAADDGEVASIVISGSPQAWVRALGPAHDPSGLRRGGATDLAERLLDALELDERQTAAPRLI
jgi:DNA-binding HxlR family transcriptional regulator